MGQPGWRHILRTEGPAYLRWLGEGRVPERRLQVLAQALGDFLIAQVSDSRHAVHVLEAVDAVMCRCNERETYELDGAAEAYAWLHLLDRYGRTWNALEVMVRRACLPVAAHGVRALDVGTGPGPAALAIADFYAALSAFAKATESPLPEQPADILCIEGSHSTNWFRHNFVEFLRDHYGLAHAFPEFQTFDPPALRRAYRSRLLDDESFDEVHQCVESVYSYGEANDEAQSMYRYRLVVFSNFLTTVGYVKDMESILSVLFSDLHPGAAVMILGASGGDYPAIFRFVDRLARKTGLRICVKDERVSVDTPPQRELILKVRSRFYDHMASLIDPGDIPDAVRRICQHREHWATSGLRVYRRF